MGAKAAVIPGAPGRDRTPPEAAIGAKPQGFFLSYQRQAIAAAAAAGQAIPRAKSKLAPPLASTARRSETMAAGRIAGDRARAGASGGRY